MDVATILTITDDEALNELATRSETIAKFLRAQATYMRHVNYGIPGAPMAGADAARMLAEEARIAVAQLEADAVGLKGSPSVLSAAAANAACRKRQAEIEAQRKAEAPARLESERHLARVRAGWSPV